MGSPLSSVVADVFMEDLEARAIEEYPRKPKLWLRYVDDVFIIWQHGEDELGKFHSFLNDRHPAIKFALEKETEGELPFLDLLVCKEENGAVGHRVYRKPTATGRYLHADSHHHPAQKRGVVKTLVNRAVKLCSNERYLKEELRRLEDELAGNGYNKKEVRRIAKEVMRSRKKAEDGQQEEVPKRDNRIGLPYIKGVTEKLSRLFGKHGVQVAAKPIDKVGELLGSTKDRQWLQDQGVYLLPCDCGRAYVGQTGKKVATRIGQHCADYRLRRVKTSAVARHGEECSGQMLFDQARVLAKEERLSRRLVREAIEIFKRPHNLNMDTGADLARSWRPVLQPSRELQRAADRARSEEGSRELIGPAPNEPDARNLNKGEAAGSGRHSAASTPPT